MTDLNALLRSIITDPDDDTVRLAYADALDELPTVTVACPRCEQYRYPGKTPDDLNLRNPTWLNCDGCDGTGTVTDPTNHNRAEKIRDAVKLAASGQAYPETLGPTPEGMRPDINEGLPAGLMATYYRGFFGTLECTAESFLRHADELIWHPTQTVTCPVCADDNSHCENCNHKGRVPRPCPDTAQPIRRVVLTETDGGLLLDGNLLYQRDENGGKNKWHCDRWPGIEFVLPIGYPDPNATYIPIFDPEASTASHP